MGNLDSIRLVEVARKGNKEAFTQIIKLYEKDLYRIAIAMLKNDDDALDAIQDSILKAFEGIRKLKKPEYFKTWLIKILINSCNAIINKKRKIVSYENYVEGTFEENGFRKIDIRSTVDKIDYELRILILQAN
ncbi:sigma-70 family RNA polymerase sigma factor [Clostridium hydrogenum]|uniref:sigma-70 family RNA polymerase sigma factor n=1 Tax=Clostridium hydrogenum TaxID=2855764 RepID=UPI001F3D522D|nr:sigma-70 family RNA polymerase sigma factor [Clostridium hydrogenum]